MNESLLTFPKGGIHPPDEKALSQDCALETMPTPEEVEILLHQHFGAPCKSLVKKKDHVEEGDLIGEVEKGLGANLHASVSGTVKGMVFQHIPYL